MYKLYNLSMILICSVLLITTKFFSKILFAKDFYEAWAYVPFLLISIVFGSLSGYIGGIFSAKKDTKTFTTTTVIGALINIIFNILFVNYFGAIGAAISTLISYFVIWFLRYIKLKAYINLNINVLVDFISYFLLLIQAMLFFIINNSIILYVCEIAILIMILFANSKTLNLLKNKVLVFMKKEK